MSYGAYAGDESHFFQSGIWQQQASPLNTDLIREDITHSWLNSNAAPVHPYQGSTIADSEDSNGYSWCKAPRLDGQVMEVGALARQVVNAHPLVRDLVKRNGGNVRERVIARLLELALVENIPAWSKLREAVSGTGCELKTAKS